MNVSSIVVYTRVEFLDKVVNDLKQCDVCDYHMHDDQGRIIITIEGEGVSEELKKLKVVEAIPHVVSAEMQMTYSEDEIDNHMEVLENQDAVPHLLHQDDIRPEEIIYNGDLKSKNLEEFARKFDKTGK